MDPIILQSATHHAPTEISQSPEKATRSTRPRRASFSSSRDSSISWGRRHHHGSYLHALGCASIMTLCPALLIFYWAALSSFQGSLTSTWHEMWKAGPVSFFWNHAPRADRRVHFAYAGWLAFQTGLYQLLPAKLSLGQLTPAGHLLKYRTNGLFAWVLTHLLFGAWFVHGCVDPAVIARHWEPLLVTVNIYGFLLTGFAYLKAHFAPTHTGDRKFSGSVLYDMYMGIELNPRFGKYFDFKLFHNGRPGIIAWTLIVNFGIEQILDRFLANIPSDLSFMAYQYQLHGFITKSMVLATVLHSIYVVDFFINEDWYLRTIDICHDHFGFYLAWGSIVWLPSIYTLQTQYLAQNPVILSNSQAAAILVTGVAGYTLFRSVNHQKDIVRRTQGDCKLWGMPAQVVRVKYRTKDGLEHDSLLLCSGWWGYARHVNYLGDLILSYSMCATCGTENILPWTYAIFMTVLLIHRCWRDEERCSQKYGKYWEEYCRRVRWVIIPGIY